MKQLTSSMTNLVTPPLINDPNMWTNGEAAGTRCKLGLQSESFITLDAVERAEQTTKTFILKDAQGCRCRPVATVTASHGKIP